MARQEGVHGQGAALHHLAASVFISSSPRAQTRRPITRPASSLQPAARGPGRQLALLHHAMLDQPVKPPP